MFLSLGARCLADTVFSRQIRQAADWVKEEVETQSLLIGRVHWAQQSLCVG